MTTPEEDEAWRLIVDHYDETAVRDPRHPAESTDAAEAGDGTEHSAADDEEQRDDAGLPPSGTGHDHGPSHRPAEPTDLPAPDFPVDPPDDFSHADQPADAWTDPDDAFVPPPAPPAPDVSLSRRIAWAAVAGVPGVFFAAALTGRTIPGAMAALLAAALAAAFVYLVVSQPREPRDPWDDGSRI